MSALERRDRETEVEMQDIRDKQEPRSEWELMKQNITDAGYQKREQRN